MKKEGRLVPMENGNQKFRTGHKIAGWGIVSSFLPGGGVDAHKSAKMYQGDTREVPRDT